MQLLIVSPSFHPAFYYGGSIYATYNNAKLLSETGIKVFVSTTDANGNKKLDVPVNKFLEINKNLFIKYYGFSNSRGFSPLMFLFLCKDLKQADVINLVSIFSPPTPLTLFLSSLLGKKVFLSPHGQLGGWCLKQNSQLKKIWLKLFIKPFGKRIYWLSTSKQEADEIKNLFPNERVFVIPNIIDFDKLDLSSQEKEKQFYERYTRLKMEQKKIIVSLSRLHKKKGYDILIEAVSILSKRYADIVLFIAGEDFGEKDNLIKLVYDLKLNDKVYILNHIDGEEKKKFLCNADLFALPSFNENFGLVYAEAMAAGLPVVASKNTPWQDVEKYNCGRCVDNTPEQTAQAIEDILKSDYKRMGANAQKFISENFSSDSIKEKYMQLFDEVFGITI